MLGIKKTHLYCLLVPCILMNSAPLLSWSIPNWISHFSKYYPALSKETFTPICQIQGSSFVSPYQGYDVYVRGIVTADFDAKRGLFAIQDDQCDANPLTSNATWVFLSPKANVVNSGDLVEVLGHVYEYFGKTEIETTSDKVWVISSNNPLPDPIELTPPQKNSESNYYFENHEAMLVSISSNWVIGATDSYADTWIAPTSLGLSRLFQDDIKGTGGVLALDDAGLYKLDHPLKVGDQVNQIIGVLDEAYEAYRIYLLAPPQVIETPVAALPHAQPLPDSDSFRLATFNLANLFDTEDDPNVLDQVLTLKEYQNSLKKRALVLKDILGEPELIVVQEAENQEVLTDLVDQAEISSDYEVVWRNTADLRGQDTALLYRTDRIVIQAVYQEQGCTDVNDGLGPDGNQDVHYPINAITCDIDENGIVDGNRLFSREPLIVFFNVNPSVNQTSSDPIILIICHWKSKVEDTSWTLYTSERRKEEAHFIAKLVQDYHTSYPNYTIIVAGDLNDYPTSQPLQFLTASGLNDLTLNTEYSSRYSYVYQGISQVTDYILILSGKQWEARSIEPMHINADFPSDWHTAQDYLNSPMRSSDHDLWQAIFQRVSYLYLPILIRSRR